MPRLDRRWVLAWGRRYERLMPPVEPRLLTEVGPAVAARGFYQQAEFAEVAAWKSPRSKPAIAANAPADVREVTGLAFGSSEHLQHRILTVLDGVGIRTATALLTVPFPDRHTVLDFRAVEALARLDLWDGTGGYPAYLDVCRRVSRRLRVPLRTLDRALWRWSRDRYAETPLA